MAGKIKLNKFEETRLLSARALEISKGAKAKIKLDARTKEDPLLSKDYVGVARQEYENDSLELEIYRK